MNCGMGNVPFILCDLFYILVMDKWVFEWFVYPEDAKPLYR